MSDPKFKITDRLRYIGEHSLTGDPFEFYPVKIVFSVDLYLYKLPEEHRDKYPVGHIGETWLENAIGRNDIEWYGQTSSEI